MGPGRICGPQWANGAESYDLTRPQPEDRSTCDAGLAQYTVPILGNLPRFVLVPLLDGSAHILEPLNSRQVVQLAEFQTLE